LAFLFARSFSPLPPSSLPSPPPICSFAPGSPFLCSAGAEFTHPSCSPPPSLPEPQKR
jgi:hypothetical protein